ncbi:MAG: hypothetical protein HPY78_07505 [Brevinematales bacterium]|nr:hypothetical protein [Brevinematales bacterium]
MKEQSFLIFWANLVWLAFRRFRKMWLWRVLLVLVNGGMLFWLSEMPSGETWWLLVLLFLGIEVIIINLKAHLESRSTVVLLRSLGASHLFLVANMLLEILVPYILGVAVGIGIKGVAIVQKWGPSPSGWGSFWMAVLVGLGCILVVVPLTTLVIVSKQERYLKEI